MIFLPMIKARVYKFINPFFVNSNDLPSILKGKNEVHLGADGTETHIFLISVFSLFFFQFSTLFLFVMGCSMIHVHYSMVQCSMVIVRRTKPKLSLVSKRATGRYRVFCFLFF